MGVMMETIALAVSCSSCGEPVAVAHNAPETESATCGACGAELGDWSEVREQARAAVFDALRDDFNEVLRRPWPTPEPAASPA